MISLKEAASRLGLSPKTIEEWADKGLLQIRNGAKPAESPEKMVDEEELAQVAENLGWFQLSAENWDEDEGE
jgi:hypothetical protein